MRLLRWLWGNLRSLLLAFVLAVAVWIVAVASEDPNDTLELPFPVAIETVGLRQGLLIVGDPPPASGRVTLRAPLSVWDLIGLDSVGLTIDLTGLEEGTHSVQVEPILRVQPARVEDHQPQSVTVTLERAATTSVDIEVVTLGEPQLGYRTNSASASPERTILLGAVSQVDQLASVRAEVNVSDRREDFEQEVTLIALDGAGNRLLGLQFEPARVMVSVRIEPRERFQLVSVVPNLEGEEALSEAGYRLTDVSVTPDVVTVFSADPEALKALPGFVLTLPLDLSGATGDLERRLSLDLPAGISPVENQGVLVRVSIAPVEGTITLSRQVEVRGLAVGLFAQLSPESVDIILTGPLPTLISLQLEDVRVIVDLLDLGPGTHQIPPQVIISQTDVENEPVFPATIEVTISNTPPPSP
ncbi:MAG: CdaR family protein [Anaerolineales bacterium]